MATSSSVEKNRHDNDESNDLLVDSPRRVLVVDDDYDSIRPLQRVLTDNGCYVQIALDGFQALDLLSELHFDLLFLDWKMPGIEGGETIVKAEKVIQARPSWKNKNLPVVTYSGQDLAELKVPSTPHFPFIDHWKKPLRFDMLQMQVKEVLNYVSNRGH